MDTDSQAQATLSVIDFPEVCGSGAHRISRAGRLAQVIELSDVRKQRMTGPDRIPERVWEDITRANEIAEDLADHGQSVRFDTHHLTGRVVASLCDADGDVIRRLGLHELLDPDPTPDHAA
jgi:hypothetical protein